ncbi:glycoside hydrolase family 18 protein [Aspergillus tanneri]|uniref:chitinase n=1 Tax=Aspergillus tanneri TaxID=1220188 RepID=A0A5M9M8K4_9EURO|nr:uncharacterized protein ATNIH1004_010865 [Aspergillus tanneri]KAA8641926.1 hypothetical protein ATNIH1004_010865 [Aspergillus tanneri]
MSPVRAFALMSAVLPLLHGVQAGFDPGSSNNVAVYWGQNSYGKSTGEYVQKRLEYYCSDIDVLQLSFLTTINGPGGAPEVNFANASDNCTLFEGTSLLNCPQIGADIKTCQKKGKTILLSIGGATYSEGGFNSDAAAQAGAKLLWETFGPVPSGNSSVKRPFGDAVIDGFDLDFEAVVRHMPAFANQLRKYYTEDSSKTYYLTAAPQCPYPDQADKEMLDGTVSFDAIWIQFYNNFCGLNSFEPGKDKQTHFNFETWDEWAHNTSLNKKVKVYVGAPGNTGAAGSGYVDVSRVKEIVQYVKKFSSFGGVMIWDASQVYANNGFLSGVKEAVGSSKSVAREFVA